MNAMTEEGTGGRTRRIPDAVQSIRIVGSLAAALAVILILSRLLAPSGPDPDALLLQTVPGDTLVSSADQDSAFSMEFERIEMPPTWLQARSHQGGNAAWGPDIGAPFDTLWSVTSSGGREFFSAPAIVDETLYLGCNDGLLRAVDTETGSVLWTFRTDCGISGESAVDSMRVYFGGQDGMVYALDRQDGSRIWSSGLGYHVFCDVAILEDTLLVTGNSMGSVCALDTRSGEVIWNTELGGLLLGPAVIDSLCVFTTENGKVAVYDASGNALWTSDYSGQASPPSVDSTGILVGFSTGIVRKLNTLTGSIIWEKDLTENTNRTVLSRPVLKDDYVLVGGTDSRFYCLNGITGETIWDRGFENWVQVPPVVGDTCVYICCDDQRLHLTDLRTGAPIDSLEMGSYAGTAPLLTGGRLYYGTSAGSLVCLQGSRRVLDEQVLQPSPTIIDSTEPPAEPAESEPAPAQSPEIDPPAPVVDQTEDSEGDEETTVMPLSPDEIDQEVSG